MNNIQQHIGQHDATYNISIQPPTSLNGNVEIPTSKSIANRSIVIDALSNNTSTFQGAVNCDDVAVMLNGIKRGNLRVRHHGFGHCNALFNGLLEYSTQLYPHLNGY